jgi:hypothetical protein
MVRGTGAEGGMTANHRVLWAAHYNMVRRCTDPRVRAYRYYGARGVRVCARWLESSAAFAADMGPRPSATHSLDRRDNDGHYSCGKCDECVARGWPANCRWATRAEQYRNKRGLVTVEIDGERRYLIDLLREHRISRQLLRARLAYGWTLVAAATTAPRPSRTPMGFAALPPEERQRRARLGAMAADRSARGSVTQLVRPGATKIRRCGEIELNGVWRNVSEWARVAGMKMTTLQGRLKRGMSLADALSRPLRKAAA